jgi:hypothetical protein
MTKPSNDTLITIASTLFFVALVIYFLLQDTTAVGPL